MSLPDKVLERLFKRLSATYGSEFINKWDKLPISDVKTAWAHELAAFADNLTVIGWALENLPERCLNAIEFKKLCRQAPKPLIALEDYSKASAVIVDAEIAEMVKAVVNQTDTNDSKRDYKAWAKKLKARHDACEKLEIFQIRSYKVALGITEKY